MRALRTHRVLSRRVFRYYYHCLRPLAYAKGGSGRLTVMAGFNDGWLEDTTGVLGSLTPLVERTVPNLCGRTPLGLMKFASP